MSKFNVKEIRKKVLETDDRVFGTVEVDEWDGVEIPFISLTMRERRRIREKSIKMLDDGTPKVDSEQMEIQAFIEACKDHDTEEKIFSQGDVEALWDKNSNAISKVANKILNTSDMEKSGEEKVEEAKNS